MHPIFGNKARLVLYLLAFTPAGGLLSLLLVLSGSHAWPEALALMLPLALLLAFLCLSAFYLCRAVPLRGASVPHLVSTHAVAAAVASALWVLAGSGLAEAFDAALLFPAAGERYALAVPLLTAVGGLFFLLAVAVHYALLALEQSHAAEKSALELAVLSREAELKALRAQLQPHFLFNALNSISALTTANPEGARQMCLLLGDFLRQSLRLGARETVPLADELANTERFLAVEKVRFGARLRTETKVDEGARGCLVPPLLLQPLVENAITHGIAGLLEGGTLSIEARLRGTELRISVQNPCDPEAPRRAGEGLGIDNVRRRLETLHGREARTDVASDAGRFRVELTLPARRADDGAVAGR